jgi:hypothetical protein
VQRAAVRPHVTCADARLRRAVRVPEADADLHPLPRCPVRARCVVSVNFVFYPPWPCRWLPRRDGVYGVEGGGGGGKAPHRTGGNRGVAARPRGRGCAHATIHTKGGRGEDRGRPLCQRGILGHARSDQARTHSHAGTSGGRGALTPKGHICANGRNADHGYRLHARTPAGARGRPIHTEGSAPRAVPHLCVAARPRAIHYDKQWGTTFGCKEGPNTRATFPPPTRPSTRRTTE